MKRILLTVGGPLLLAAAFFAGRLTEQIQQSRGTLVLAALMHRAFASGDQQQLENALIATLRGSARGVEHPFDLLVWNATNRRGSDQSLDDAFSYAKTLTARYDATRKQTTP